ncbi:PQQ-binding-like beta-propeller repeat protein [Propionicicella superfundia]|uniref:outer membrane protein assembly factor BamB family protein n=1 Tax=Propionicicella superfundia TaxID=348582 RepID=UPI00041D0516|nr:PQQ-binding-like beta-propeller repeat protein [Propionicicella superfundia]
MQPPIWPGSAQAPGPLPGAPPPVAPPRLRRESSWVALLLAGLSLALLTGLTVYASRPLATAPLTRAGDYIPEDGHRELLAATATVRSAEWARLQGPRALASGPAEFLDAAIDYAGLTGAHYVRLTYQTYPAATFQRPDDTLLENDERGLHRVVEMRDGTTYYYDDAETALPLGVAAGSAWQSTGTLRIRAADGEIRTTSYLTLAEAETDDSGCLVVTERQSIEGDTTRTSSTTWCRGRGIVAQQRGGETLTGVTDWPSDADPRSSVGTEGFTEPATLRGWHVQSHRQSAQYGTQPRTTPTMVVRNLYLYGSANTDDLVALAVPESGGTQILWRGHPGGTLLTTAQFGEVTVVTTSRRRLAAYTTSGLRLWDAATPDVAPTDLARVDDRTFVAAFLDGTVAAYDIATGRQLWRAALPAQIWHPPVVTAATVFAVDTSGAAVALDAATGVERWARSLPDPPAQVVACGGLIITGDAFNPRITALDAHTGATAWSHYQPGSVDSMTCLEDQTVLGAETEVVAISAQGRKVWTAAYPSRAPLLAYGGAALVVSGDTLIALDTTGTAVGRWPVSLDPAAADVGLAAGETCFVVLDSTGALAVGTPP